MKSLQCRDAGFDCDAVVQADTNEEIFRQVRTHAQEVHGTEVTPEMEQQLTGVIRDQ